MQGSLTEAKVQKMHDYEHSDLSEREKMALRLADKLACDHQGIDAAFMAQLRTQFSDDEMLDLGMSMAFLFGWGRFVEAFGIVPDSWEDDTAKPWEAAGTS
jgi:alkylhydroperoxidase family enzyme